MYDKVLGCILGGAVGDAMGANTETKTTEQIYEIFSGRVTKFEYPAEGAFAYGNEPGQVTDDFSVAYFMAQAVLKNGGIVEEQSIKEAIIDWSTHAVFDKFAGPTTRFSIKKFKGEDVEREKNVNYDLQASNGSAMRIAPISLFSNGDIDLAIENAVIATMTTHDNDLAISGACAVAAAVSEAMKDDADLYSVVKAGLYGARQGEIIGAKRGRVVSGPTVIRRMERAIEIALSSSDSIEVMNRLEDEIGNSLHISDTVGTAFGLLMGSPYNVMEPIYGGVNIGYDSDTIATIAGGMSGALYGYKDIPADFIGILDKMNGFELKKLADNIYKHISKEGGKNV